jgi:transcriptional regulator with XRE-family HTH domain
VDTTTTSTLDLGATLRGLRRRADLSQRELAARAGVPASTVARIEAGTACDPKFRTVERLVAAAGAGVTVGSPSAPTSTQPDDDLVDGAGRRYPAHLDVRRVTEAKDWWGAWWANWYDLPRHRWPRPAPDYTFDLDRDRRDDRRSRERGRRAVAGLRVERLPAGEAPETVWRWLATDSGTGDVVGWLGGFVRRRRIDGEREFVVCDIEVAPGWRRWGLGRRLVESLRAELAPAGVARARVLVDEPGLPYLFIYACGFGVRGPQPAWLFLPAGRRRLA